MCGISGFVNNNNLNPDDQIRVIKKMNNSLKHEPDFQDYWIDPK